MNIYLWALLAIFAVVAALYWWSAVSLAADTVAHDSHEAEEGE